MIRKILAPVAMMAAAIFLSATASAQVGPGNLSNPLFAQLTTQGAGSITAAAYPAPHPVPAYVGHSYNTYQPLMPHQMLYTHQRNYYNYYNDHAFYGGGQALNVTSVRWQSGAFHVGQIPFGGRRLSNLRYAIAAKAYCLDRGDGGAAAPVACDACGGN